MNCPALSENERNEDNYATGNVSGKYVVGRCICDTICKPSDIYQHGLLPPDQNVFIVTTFHETGGF